MLGEVHDAVQNRNPLSLCLKVGGETVLQRLSHGNLKGGPSWSLKGQEKRNGKSLHFCPLTILQTDLSAGYAAVKEPDLGKHFEVVRECAPG